MSCRTEVADFWDSVLEGWRADPELKDVPEVLREWRKSYAGEVDLRHYPEGFVGDLRGEQREPRIVVLGLNPGIGYEPLTGAHGKWVQAIKEHSYSRSSQHRVPFENADWRKLHNGKDSLYWVRLINFARRWFGDDRAGVADVLNFEMFPFHSNNLKANIRPPNDIIDRFVWAPLQEMEAKVVFAFGKPWHEVCANLLGNPIASYGPRALGDKTNGNWQVKVFSFEKKHIVVSSQQGFSGPPGPNNIEGLRSVVERL